MPDYDDLPYRPCVGLMVLNREGHAFIGRRSSGPEHIDAVHVWQMPQGGIDKGEDPYPAALRELREETSIHSVAKLGEIEEWLTYDIPRAIGTKAWKGKYRGQTQKWFALRFVGAESEIDLECHGHPEFDAWKWVEIDEVVRMIVPFKRDVYRKVVEAFRSFARPG